MKKCLEVGIWRGIVTCICGSLSWLNIKDSAEAKRVGWRGAGGSDKCD